MIKYTELQPMIWTIATSQKEQNKLKEQLQIQGTAYI